MVLTREFNDNRMYKHTVQPYRFLQKRQMDLALAIPFVVLGDLEMALSTLKSPQARMSAGLGCIE